MIAYFVERLIFGKTEATKVGVIRTKKLFERGFGDWARAIINTDIMPRISF